LIFNESVEPVFPYELQVFYHAHPITGSIPFVNGFQSFTWKTVAFVTKSQLAFGEYTALFLKKPALLVSWSATRTTYYFNAFASQIVSIRQVTSAQGAIHTAWCNQCGIYSRANGCQLQLAIAKSTIKLF
jgi:hypothetical protein